MSAKKGDRVGEVSYTKYGTKATIVEYVNNKEVLIEFDDEHKYRYFVTYLHFKKGQIYNPFDRTVCGIGYLGNGRYSNISNDNYELKHCYKVWNKMIQRCYMSKELRDIKHMSYEDCVVCEEWHCFNNFAEWYLSNKYNANGEPLNIDKDILFRDNKLYSPDNCLLVPREINLLFIKGKSIRGDLPIGVTYYWNDNSRYLASMKIGDGKSFQIGVYSTVDEAFQAYKREKEKRIKEMADKYKSVIPEKLYNAMYNYEVLITD